MVEHLLCEVKSSNYRWTCLNSLGDSRYTQCQLKVKLTTKQLGNILFSFGVSIFFYENVNKYWQLIIQNISKSVNSPICVRIVMGRNSLLNSLLLSLTHLTPEWKTLIYQTKLKLFRRCWCDVFTDSWSIFFFRLRSLLII